MPLLQMAETAPELDFDGLDWQNQRVILATVHRRENWGDRLKDIADGMLRVLDRFPTRRFCCRCIATQPCANRCRPSGEHPKCGLTEPLDYDRLVAAMKGCTLLLTDSGGLQEEAPALGKPVLVLRRTTERPEAVEAGTARLVGTDAATILEEASRLLEDSAAYDAMSRAVNPFGDGQASQQNPRSLPQASRRLKLDPDSAQMAATAGGFVGAGLDGQGISAVHRV